MHGGTGSAQQCIHWSIQNEGNLYMKHSSEGCRNQFGLAGLYLYYGCQTKVKIEQEMPCNCEKSVVAQNFFFGLRPITSTVVACATPSTSEWPLLIVRHRSPNGRQLSPNRLQLVGFSLPMSAQFISDVSLCNRVLDSTGLHLAAFQSYLYKQEICWTPVSFFN